MRLVRVLCCAAAIVAFLAPGARADEWNKLTYLTFSGPVQVPGATLPAGTYMFRLADTMTSRHVVQVFDKDGKKLYATVLAIPDQRLNPSGKNIVLFAERPSGAPQAVKAWWYPGDVIGDEFVYPKSQAVRIARDTHQSVLATDDEGTSDSDHMKSAKVGRVDENGNMTSDTDNGNNATTTTADRTAAQNAPAPANTAPAPATTGTTAGTTAGSTAATTARNQPASPSRTTTAQPTGTSGQSAPKNRELPRTGSELPLLELLSGISLAGAFGARRLRQRLGSTR